MAEKSAIQRIKELDEERAKVFEQAKEEALEKATQAVAELNALGLNYQLTNGEMLSKPDVVPQSKPAGEKRGAVRQSPCPLCGFATSPPHDRRAHRWQKKKAPFSAAELKEKGLVRLSG